MSAAITLRDDFGADDLRGLAAKAKDANQARRLLALAAIRDGRIGRKPPVSAAWIARRCAIGCTPSTRGAWMG